MLAPAVKVRRPSSAEEEWKKKMMEGQTKWKH
jgi:hypothetical protein